MMETAFSKRKKTLIHLPDYQEQRKTRIKITNWIRMNVKRKWKKKNRTATVANFIFHKKRWVLSSSLKNKNKTKSPKSQNERWSWNTGLKKIREKVNGILIIFARRDGNGETLPFQARCRGLKNWFFFVFAFSKVQRELFQWERERERGFCIHR